MQASLEAKTKGHAETPSLPFPLPPTGKRTSRLLIPCNVLSSLLDNISTTHRKTHQRALDSMQASLEAEAKGRAEAMRMKKKLEQDINELEISLDQANKANAEAQKTIRRYQAEIIEIQVRERGKRWGDGGGMGGV